MLASAGQVHSLDVADGESAKTPEVATSLWQTMLELGGKRDSRLVTLGGGTVGDLGGFVAGCFLRGIAFVQVPTTLLAQVDAAVGGKTGVDLPGGKNTVGLFHHPDRVVADTRFLATLPIEELRSGLVEAIKMAFLLNPEQLTPIEQDLSSLLEGEPEALAPVVAGAIATKRNVVEVDPREGGTRRLLNFGHTLGHAIETACGYQGLRHGEAVAYGMLFALRLAEARDLPREDAERLQALLRRLDLPPLPVLDPDELMTLMARDKKASERGLAWVLPRRLGVGEITTEIDAAQVRAMLVEFLAGPLGG